MKNNLYTIPAHLPFADTLARWVLERYGGSPVELPRVLLLLPSRRAQMALREAFLKASGGKPLLLPRMQPLGEVDEDLLLLAPANAQEALAAPEPAFEMKRLFVLARLVRAHRSRILGYEERMDHALRLAIELARLLDETEREQVSLEGLAQLVPETFAAHWQVTVEFLHILSRHWPQIAKEEGLVSAHGWRNHRLGALAQAWRGSPPGYPVIAAGTTGSIPATAHLLGVVAQLPQGCVVLPGLDTHSDDAYFAHVGETHPQWGMLHLLAKLRCERAHVQTINAAHSGRVQLLAEVMRPAETSQVWRQVKLDRREALAGMRYVDCAHAQEEAVVIALMLRETLAVPGKTAALITHDRPLARRVGALMRRFGVVIDDSAGIPLLQTPAVSFLRLILEVAAKNAAPVPLLSLLKHPHAQAGLTRMSCLEAARMLETRLLRGLAPAGGLAGLKSALATDAPPDVPPDVHRLLDNLIKSFAPLMALFESGREMALAELAQAHMQCAESLAGEDWLSGPEADALEAFLSDLRQSAAHAGAALAVDYPYLFDALLAGKVLRPEYGMHPRLKILSPIEARMQSFDRIILGGLNEGCWPMEPEDDPWFNRSMRSALGLPASEQRIGLSAHDFFMLAASPEVMLTRAGKSDGVPTTPSRWLAKMEVLLDRVGGSDALKDTRWNTWAAALDAPQRVEPCRPPEPRPPLSARPRAMSVTKIETWMRNPYAIYASQILGLYPLAPLEQELGRGDFGSAVHKALERFVRACPRELPPDAYERLLRSGREVLSPLFAYATVEAWWWPRFMRIARWAVEQERRRRPLLARVLAEAKGTYRVGDFTLTGKADRIEEARDGGIRIVDYKTGTPPSVRDIEAGLASQLALLALIACEGELLPLPPKEADFLDERSEFRKSGEGRGAPSQAMCPHSPHPTLSRRERALGVTHLEYWHLQGGHTPGRVIAIAEAKIGAYMEEAKEGLQRLIEQYNDPDFPYRATPIPARASKYSDYDHLARVKEWG